MTELLLPPPTARDTQDASTGLTPAQATLRQMVLDAVTSPSTRHSYGQALDDLFGFSAGRLLTRALLQEGVHGRALRFDRERPALGRPQAGRGGPA